MKRTTYLSRAFLLLLAAASPLAIQPTLAAPAEAVKTGPAMGSFGVDMKGMDTSVKPGDGFYRFVNGKWDDNTPIPDDKSRWGMFDELRELSLTRTHDILVEAAAKQGATGNQRKIGDFFASLMDEAAIEKAGLAPLKPELDAIAAVKDRHSLSAWLGGANRSDFPVIGVEVDSDLNDSSRVMVHMGQNGLGMPSRDYYLDAKMATQKAAYEQHIARMLVLGGKGEADAKAMASRVLALETEIAKVHWDRVQQRQAEKRNNPIKLADLGKQYPGVDWAAFNKAAGIDGQADVNIAHPSAIAGIAKLVGSQPLESWRDWMTYHALRTNAVALPKALRDEKFAFHDKLLSGVPAQEVRWKQAAGLTTNVLGEAIGPIYVERYFPPEAKAQMDALVKNVITAMDVRLSKLDWMEPATKTAARSKLASFTPKIGYPDKWRDYSALEVKAGDALGNLRRAGEFEYQRGLNKLGKPVDRSEWYMTPMTVNAYANPTWNEIVFPAAILQAPFFDPKADPAVNYGGIGAVIGHEILHHFDDQGRKYDARGNLTDWWTQLDIDRFAKLTDKLVAQVETYEPLPGKHINGKLSLGENIADIAGLNTSWDAYQMSLNGKPAPVIDGKTGAERFYLGFGQIWRTRQRPEAVERQLLTGPHSPSFIRPETVRNHDEWYKTFDVKRGEKLYLAPEERVKIW